MQRAGHPSGRRQSPRQLPDVCRALRQESIRSHKVHRLTFHPRIAMNSYNFVTAEIISSDKAGLPSIAMNERAPTPDELPIFDQDAPFVERLEQQLNMRIRELSFSNERLQ